MPKGDGICFETTKKRVVSDAPMALCFMVFSLSQNHFSWNNKVKPTASIDKTYINGNPIKDG